MGKGDKTVPFEKINGSGYFQLAGEEGRPKGERVEIFRKDGEKVFILCFDKETWATVRAGAPQKLRGAQCLPVEAKKVKKLKRDRREIC